MYVWGGDDLLGSQTHTARGCEGCSLSLAVVCHPHMEEATAVGYMTGGKRWRKRVWESEILDY